MLAFDSRRNRVVMFGGIVTGPVRSINDTWEWDGTSWSSVAPTAAPADRTDATAAFDDARGVVVMFGGVTFGQPYGNETWEFDGGTWVQRATSNQPPARAGAAMVYDSRRSKMVLFGGQANGGNRVNDTWEYDGVNWTQRYSAPSPPPRVTRQMSYDPLRGKTVLFSGSLEGSFPADTWEWDGNAWTLASIDGGMDPAGRVGALMVFDSHVGATLLFGGGCLTLSDPNLWAWRGQQWEHISIDGGPDNVCGTGFAFDSTRGQSILFGGADYRAGTWVLGP